MSGAASKMREPLAVAHQWRQLHNGKWNSWNSCWDSASLSDNSEYWLGLAAKVPSEVQVRPVYAALQDELNSVDEIPPHVRDFLGKVQGVCMAVAISGDDHPNPDGALLEIFNEAQAILFPAASMEGQP